MKTALILWTIMVVALIIVSYAHADPCDGVTINGQSTFFYAPANECCSNGQCVPVGNEPAPTPTPRGTPGPTPVPTPAPVTGPESMSGYSATCPEQSNVIDGANGVIEINCPGVIIDCSQLAGGVLRKWRITPQFTWFMSQQVPRDFSGYVMARSEGCSLQPLTNAESEGFGPGEGGFLASCFYRNGGCSEADAIRLTPFVAVPVVWETTDVFPEINDNQLFAILEGK